MARLHGTIEQLQRPLAGSGRKTPVLFRFHPDAGSAATAFDGTAQSERARRGRSQNYRGYDMQHPGLRIFTDCARGNCNEDRNTEARYRKHIDAHPEIPVDESAMAY